MDTVLPIVLLVVLGGLGALVARSLRRRKDFLKTVTLDDSALPDLTTEQRLTLTLRRLWRDPQQDLPLVEAGIEGGRLIFCPTDHDKNAERYKTNTGKSAEVALFALATLALGGVEAMKGQIIDADKKSLPPEMVALLHQGQLDNDYVVICRILSVREATWGELSLVVYQAQVGESSEGPPMVLDLAVPNDSTQPFLAVGSLAHGSARLFGYLA